MRIDETVSSEYVPFEFDLYGSGRLYFGSSANREANSFYGLLKDVKKKFFVTIIWIRNFILKNVEKDLRKIFKCGIRYNNISQRY